MCLIVFKIYIKDEKSVYNIYIYIFKYKKKKKRKKKKLRKNMQCTGCLIDSV
jgi:hypothetical protein